MQYYKFKLFFELQDGSIDELIVEGESIEQIRIKAEYEKKKRNAKDAWSEQID